MHRVPVAFVLVVALTPAVMAGQVPPTSFAAVVPENTTIPEGYVIGPEDVLGVTFWRDADMTGDHAVRPDGMITLPLVGDIRAAGLAPEALKNDIEKAASRLITEPNVTVTVRAINSRKVYITGQVAAPGVFPLTGPLTVMQLIALAGGLLDYADANNITTLRAVNGKQVSYRFRYKDVARGKGLAQNIELQPGDTVVVP